MHTLTFRTWADVPADIASHCMERLSPGVYRHARLSLVLVMLNETNTPDGVRVLADEVTDQSAMRSRRRALAAAFPCDHDGDCEPPACPGYATSARS